MRQAVFDHIYLLGEIMVPMKKVLSGILLLVSVFSNAHLFVFKGSEAPKRLGTLEHCHTEDDFHSLKERRYSRYSKLLC